MRASSDRPNARVCPSSSIHETSFADVHPGLQTHPFSLNISSAELRCMKDARVICFTASEASSDGPWTPCVEMWSRSLHLVLWFENEQVPHLRTKPTPYRQDQCQEKHVLAHGQSLPRRREQRPSSSFDSRSIELIGWNCPSGAAFVEYWGEAEHARARTSGTRPPDLAVPARCAK